MKPLQSIGLMVSGGMDTIAEQIAVALRASFPGAGITVADDSATHAGHAGARAEGNTHFSVAISSDAFQGMSRVARHRAVYAALSGFFEMGLHALAIEANAPGEESGGRGGGG